MCSSAGATRAGSRSGGNGEEAKVPGQVMQSLLATDRRGGQCDGAFGAAEHKPQIEQSVVHAPLASQPRPGRTRRPTHPHLPAGCVECAVNGPTQLHQHCGSIAGEGRYRSSKSSALCAVHVSACERRAIDRSAKIPRVHRSTSRGVGEYLVLVGTRAPVRGMLSSWWWER
jgi:hypothetical protein